LNSCSNSVIEGDDFNFENRTINFRSDDEINGIGEFHNLGLDSLFNVIPDSSVASTKKQVFDLLMEEGKSFYYNNCSLLPSYYPVDSSVNSVDSLLLVSCIDTLLNGNYQADPERVAKASIDLLYEDEIISSTEKNMLYSALENAENIDSLQALQDQWNQLFGSQVNTTAGSKLTYGAISVGIASYYYWNDSNAPNQQEGARANPADIGGFIVGFGISYVMNRNDPNWLSKSILLGIMSALIGSLGIVAKLGQWIYGLF
jgi:hypothetical protein